MRSSLIYTSPVWNPHHKIYSDEIERVQHQFLKSYSHRFATPMEFNDHNYKTVSKCTDISSLASFRSYQDVLFMYKLLNFRVDCPALLQSVNIYIIYAPVRSLRPRNLFAPRELHTDLKFK